MVPRTHRGSLWRLVALAFVLACSGCVLPFAIPPVRVTQSFGVAAGTLRPDRTARRLRVSDVEPVTSTRIGLHLMPLAPSLRRRRFDFGLGYGFETFTADQLLGQLDKHSIYAELTAFPLLTMFDRSVGTRIGTTLIADVLFGDAGFGVEVGGGASLALTLEIFGFTDGPFGRADPDTGVVTVGGALGEWAVGMSVYGAYRVLDGASYGQLGVALSVRLPASAGVLLYFPRAGEGRGRSDDEFEQSRGTVDVNSPDGDEYHVGDTTPSDGGIGAQPDDDDDGTVQVNPPPNEGTVEVNPPSDRGTVEVNPP